MTTELRAILARVMTKLPTPVEPTPEEQLQLARETERRIWLETAPKIGVPRRLWDASFEAGLPSSSLARVRQFIEGGEAEAGGCLVLTGPTGVGKSYGAVAGLRAWDGGGRRFFYFPALCGALLDAQRRVDALETVKRRQFVVLDDLGVEYVKDGGLVEAFLDEIIWYREAELLPTIVTSNLTAEQLKGRLSDRILDRFRGNWGRAFAATGASLRSASAGEECTEESRPVAARDRMEW